MKTILALLVLAGVAAADDAMVREDTTFYLVPGNARTAFQFFALHDDAIPVTIVAQSGDMLEVELVQTDTCAGQRLVPDERVTGLRFHVRRADLVPVLTRPFAIAFANGTSVRVAPGMPVVRTDDGAYAIFPRGDRIVLPIPDSSVGETYKRSKVRVDAPTETSWEMEEPGSVTLGNVQIEMRGRWTSTKSATRDIVKWSARCIELAVSVPAKRLVKYRGPELTPLFKRERLDMPHVISRGTSLATPTGERVGAAHEPILTRLPADGLACFDAVFTLQRVVGVKHSYERRVELCGQLTPREP